MKITQINNIKEWPGPDDAGVMSMALRHQRFIDQICNESDFVNFNKEVTTLVRSWSIQDGDAWDIESTKFWFKAWIITMIKYCGIANIEIPLWLRDEMAVVQQGSFPIGYRSSSMEVMLVI